MYGGYPGAYSAYGNPQQQPAANATNPYQQTQQQQQPPNYYVGVNQYENYGYGGINAPLPPPPPPPPAADYFQTFPSQATKLTTQNSYHQNRGYSQPASSNAYEAAIHNYAAQNSSGPQKPWKAGGGGRYGRQGTGDNKQYYCEICKVSCAGGITYKEHLDGQRHKKKELLEKQGLPSTSLAKNKLSYRCDLCQVTCTGHDTYSAHVRGGKHLKTVNLHRKLGKPVPEDVPTIIAPGADGPTETKAKPKWHQQPIPGTKKVVGINTINFVGGSKLSTTGKLEDKKREVAAAVSSVGKPTIEVEDEKLKAMMEAEEVTPVGEEHVTEERDATGKLVQFHCKLCDCKFSDPNAKEIHVKGRRHRLSYRQKIDPTLVVDMKPSKRSEKNKKGGSDPSSASSQFLNRHIWFAGPTAQGRVFNLSDERTFEAKYVTLNPGPEFMENLARLGNEIDQAMLSVSHKIEETMFGAASTKDTPTEKKLIVDVHRIGTISKATFIKGEPLAEMVAVCSVPPTPEIVQQIKDLFPTFTTSLTMSVDPSSTVCLMISADFFPELQTRITLTYNNARSSTSDDGLDSLDKLMCVHALACIRGAKWYFNYCFHLNACQQVIRVFRDTRSRFPVWNALDDLKLEAVVCNVISSSATPLNPSEGFKRVLEAISSGYLFSAILADPCENTCSNLMDGLNDEQKHALTICAQNFVRQIAFNQIHEVLGIDRVVISSPLKRQIDSNQNCDIAQNEEEGEPEVKKEKAEVEEDAEINEDPEQDSAPIESAPMEEPVEKENAEVKQDAETNAEAEQDAAPIESAPMEEPAV